MPSIDISKFVFFTDTFDYPVDGALFSIGLTVASLSGYSVFGKVKFWIC